MAGGGQQVDVIATALGVGAVLDGGIIGFEDAAHKIIGLVIIVAVPRRAVQKQLAHAIRAFEVGVQGGEQLGHA